MPSILGFILSISVLLFALSSAAKVENFDFEKTKKTLLNLVNDPPVTKMALVGEIKDPKARRFFEYYQKTVYPLNLSTAPVLMKLNILTVLIDGGYFSNETERDLWIAQRDEYQDQWNHYSTDSKVTKIFEKWAKLAEGLRGDLPDQAKSDYKNRVRYTFPPNQHKRLNEWNRLKYEFDLAMTDAKANDDLEELEIKYAKVIHDFKNGNFDFQTAARKIDYLVNRAGYRFVAAEALEKYPEHLNRMAVLRTELAHSKGFANWATYKLSIDDGYDESFRGVQAQKDFLKRYIASMAPRVRKMLDERASEMGLDPDKVTSRYSALIYPKDIQVLTDNFPATSITSIWLEAMSESGFTEHSLSQVFVDAGIRSKKNLTMAYQIGLLEPQLDVQEITGSTLNYVVPPRESPLWNSAVAYILQSYKAGGYNDLETMFHEGGHALEMLLKHKTYYTDESGAYVETPSTSMEHFVRDPEFLAAKMQAVNGTKPSVDEIKQLVSNQKVRVADTRLRTAAYSLMDFDLWDYDYTQPNAESFMQRLKHLNEEMAVNTLERRTALAGIPAYYADVATDHHYSATVDYIGYILAELSSQQMVEYIRDELEKTTGRRSFLNQPGLAKLFGDNFFAEGWKTGFPANIEKITGRKFDPEVLTEEFFEEAQHPGSCQQTLR